MNPPFEREVRLGLVLYGGVSLAIYINGVAQEFFNAVKGRGVYRLIKALTDSDIVVDIVSGTSAGGINGVLLAYALANDLDFRSCATLWREHADIQRMLRSVTALRPPSVLDSEGYFQRHLEDIYATMPVYRRQPGDEPWESVLEALDLSVTGTDYDGELATHFDSLGHSIVVKDHRKVFKLKYRRRRSQGQPGVGNDFARDGRGRVRALATLSRITATFPVAFAPVEVPARSSLPSDAVDREAASLLHMWGAFGNETTRFLDGGVLDNKPFSYTIRDIYYRTSERRVERKLFYVEPDPERFVRAARTVPPDLFQVVMAALIGIPGYESIADDLRAIDDRNSRLQRYNEIVAQVRHGVLEAGTTPSQTQLELHRQSRIGAIRDGFLEHLLRARKGLMLDPAQQESVRRLAKRLVEFFVTWPVQQQQQLLEAFDSDFLTRRLFHVTYFLYDLLYPPPGDPEPDAGARRRYRNLLYALNRQIQVVKVVDYALGRLQDEMWLFGETPSSTIDPNPEGREGLIAGALWGETRSLLLALLTTSGIRSSGGAELPPLDQWLARAYGGLPPLDEEWDRWAPPSPDARPGEGWLSDRVIGGLAGELDRRVQALAPRAHELHRALTGVQPPPSVDVVDPAAPTLVEALEARSRAILLAFRQDAVDRVYEHFAHIDAHLFPLEYLSDLQEKDAIEIVRISPLDATRGFCRGRSLEDKIAGDALHHFGGFFKRSWRSNDILWGRLDTVNLLLESLLSPERVARQVGTVAGRQRIRTLLQPNPTDAVAALFPHVAAGARANIVEWLDALLAEPANPNTPNDPAPARRQGALALLAPSRPDGILEVLVEAAQREILETDLSDVIQDAVDQSVEWGVTRRPDPVGGYDRLDVDELAGAVVRERAREVIDAVAAGGPPPAQAPLNPWQRWFVAMGQKFRGLAPPRGLIADPAGFFRNRYRVGSEDVARAIPPLVLTEIVSHALIVLKNAALGGINAQDHPGLGRVVRPLRWLVDYPLRITYWLTGLVRRQPGLGALHVTVTLLSLVLLAIGWNWRDAIWWIKQPDGGGHRLDRVWTIVFIGIPLVTLVVQAIVLSWGERRGRMETAVYRIRVVAGVAAAGSILYGLIAGHYAVLGAWLSGSIVNLASIVSGPTRLWIVLPAALILLVLLLGKFSASRRA